jgi:hypothetical protein
MNFRGVVDILGIVLPALILMLGIIRQFSKNRRGHNTITIICAILLLLIGLIHFYLFPAGNRSDDPESKLKPIHVSKHSESFNQSIQQVLHFYYKTTEAFAIPDTSSINQSSHNLKMALDNFRLDDLKTDTIIYETALQPFENAKAGTVLLFTGSSIDAKRMSLKDLSDNLFSLLSIVHYDVAKLYWLECDRAFGENNPGNWLSKSQQSANPYGQKDCLEVKTTIDFVPIDTTIKAK